MAAALVVAAEGRVGKAVDIAATGFDADGTLTVTIDKLSVSGAFLLDASGDLASPSPLQWIPTAVGTYTVRADDGTDELTADIRIWSNT